MASEQFSQLLQFFKVLGNENRLKILGLLANKPWSVSELAAFLDLTEPTVSHHLASMKSLGIVQVEADGNMRIYSLDAGFLETMSKDIFSQTNLASLVENKSEDDFAAKVRQTFIKNGRLTSIPARRKKERVILEWLVQKFEYGRRYPERELNEIISRVHPDYASLRRLLIEEKLMARENNVYWRIDDLS